MIYSGFPVVEIFVADGLTAVLLEVLAGPNNPTPKIDFCSVLFLFFGHLTSCMYK